MGRLVSGPVNWLTPDRLVTMSWVAVLVYVGFLATWAWVSHGFVVGSRPGVDFSIFWAAAHLMLQGEPAYVYEHVAFMKTQLDLFGSFADTHGIGWAYPPAFLTVITPLALFPYAIAYLLFVAVGTWGYASLIARISNIGQAIGRRWLGALVIAASPCVFVAAIIGQNSLLTAALAALAVIWIVQRPVAAGICIGLLAIKPQMAIVFPFVLIASRAWKVFAVAALTGIVTTTLGVVVCGSHSIVAFFNNANVLRVALLDHGGQSFWFASPTVLSALRLGGFPVIAAYAGHTCVAIVAISAAWHVWRQSNDLRLRAAIFAIAALLASPYVWHYELAWLGIALASLGALAIEGGWSGGEQTAWLIGWLLPIYEHFNRLMMLPQIGPLVLLTLLWMVLRRADKRAGGER
jgi:hypothetical protein